MEETRYKTWDIVFKGVAAIGLIVTSWLAVQQYQYNSAKDEATAKIEARRPFYVKHWSCTSAWQPRLQTRPQTPTHHSDRRQKPTSTDYISGRSRWLRTMSWRMRY